MSYIEHLTEEDIKVLMTLCLENPEEIETIHYPSQIWNNLNTDHILIRTINGNEILITDFDFQKTYGPGCWLKEDAFKAFSAYMAYKFGTLYLKNYTESKTHVNYYKDKVERALDQLTEAQKEARAKESELLDYYNKFDFTALFNSPIKLS